MISISTDESKYKEDELIRDNESFFNNNVTAKSFTEDSIKAMMSIDKAILLDASTGKIETPYGICSIESLSSGCKTVLNYYFIKSFPNLYPNIKAISANECGCNALEELFKAIENIEDKIEVLLQHDNKTYNCSDRTYRIDGIRTIESMFDF